MSASQSGVFSLQEFTDVGAPLVAGRLYTYTQGTTTHKTAYTDKAGSIAHTYTSDGVGGQYIGLNARGELPAPLYLAAGSYDIALKDSTGATIWTRRADPVDDTASAYDAAIRSDLASSSVGLGSKMIAFIRRVSGAVARWVEDKLMEHVSVFDFMTPAQIADVQAYTYSLDMSGPLQAAVNKAKTVGPSRILMPWGGYRLDTVIDLNDDTSTTTYRRAVKIRGDGIQNTRILVRSSVAAFRNKITVTQGNNNYFSRGMEISELDIFADGSTPAGAVAIDIQGTYYPKFDDLVISGMPSHGIATRSDARWGNPDRYACADVLLNRVNILSCGGWGVYSSMFTAAYKVKNGYIVSNVGGGLYLTGSPHLIEGGSVAGNGALADANSCGIWIARTSDGTPQNPRIIACEIDSNFNNQIRLESQNGVVTQNRFVDTAASGSFLSPVQVLVRPISGVNADSNVVERNYFRYDSQGAANVASVKFDLSVDDGARTCRYNISRANTSVPNGATTGVVTECDFGTNPNAARSKENRHYTNDSPEGSTKNGNFTRDISLASGTQTITGVGFRPKNVSFQGMHSGGVIVANGNADQGGANQCMHYYATGTTWVRDTSRCQTFRTGAGDIYDGYVSSFTDDGFVITWTKTGAPTGTASILFTATR